MPACASGTFLFTAVPPLDLGRIASNAPNTSGRGRRDRRQVLRATGHPRDNELYGCEDPKIYRANGRYFLFYNAVFPIDPDDASRYPSPNYALEDIGCDINVAVSDDLVSWTKIGPIVPHEVSRLWCKGAVIPRDANGNAVRVGGEFLMYLSEGCYGTLLVGLSLECNCLEFEV